MDKTSLKNIMTAVRDMILRHRVAYRDYLGEEDVTETKIIAKGSFVAGDDADLTVKDPSFKTFSAGEDYDVAINGATKKMTARNIAYLHDFLT